MKTENEIRLILADYPDSLPSDEELMIAVFMGLQPLIVNEHHKIVGWYRDDPKKWFSFPEYKTWNDLMPVVEKIESLGYEVDIMRGVSIQTVDHFTKRIVKTGDSKIQSVYKAVVEFIKMEYHLINVMNSFASQESKRAVDEFKEKLKVDIKYMRNRTFKQDGMPVGENEDFVRGCDDIS